MAITVKYAQLGKKVEEAYVEDGSTIAQVFAVLGASVPSGHELRLDGEPAELGDTLEDGNIITTVANAKGGKS